MINIYDYETLGQNTYTCPVVCVAAGTFDDRRFASDNPYTWEEIKETCSYMKFDVAEQCEKFGVKPEKGTMQWWKEQMADAPVLKELMAPSSEDVSITECIPFLVNVFTPDSLTYTRSCMFDHSITSRLCRTLNQEYPYPFWLERDTRSWLEGVMMHLNSNVSEFRNGFMPKEIEESFIKHDPIDDISADVFRIQKLIRLAQGLEGE